MRKGQSPEQSRKAPIGKSQQRLPWNSPGLRHAVTHCRAGGHPRNAPGRKGEPKRLGLPTPVQKARGGSRPPAGTPRPSRARPRSPERRTWVPGHVPGDAVVAVEELLPQELVAGHGAPLPAHEAHREHVFVWDARKGEKVSGCGPCCGGAVGAALSCPPSGSVWTPRSDTGSEFGAVLRGAGGWTQ